MLLKVMRLRVNKYILLFILVIVNRETEVLPFASDTKIDGKNGCYKPKVKSVYGYG